MTLAPTLLLSTALFAIGLYGLLARRNAIAILISIELMVNAASLNLVAFTRFHGLPGGQALAAFLLALTVAEIVVGLAIVITLARARREGGIDVDSAREYRMCAAWRAATGDSKVQVQYNDYAAHGGPQRVVYKQHY